MIFFFQLWLLYFITPPLEILGKIIDYMPMPDTYIINIGINVSIIYSPHIFINRTIGL